MKKNIQKNCIAFTLMEMTLVLLITSIIAAASTPIVTSAVSDYAERAYAPTEGESADAPWRNASGYNGGGIYNPPIEATSPVGINSKFGSSASNYKYPALAIEARDGNLISNPQIQVRVNSNNSLLSKYSNISMDAYENIAFIAGTEGSFTAGKEANASNNYIGARNIFMGSMLQSYSGYTYSDMYYNNSVFLGSMINSRMAENVISIGNKISKHSHERNTINLGYNLNSSYSSSTYQGNVIIGHYSNLTSVRDVITIGNFASQNSAYVNDISIGHGAGEYSIIFSGSLPETSNIAIGAYASKRFMAYSGSPNIKDRQAISIGYKAGYIENSSESYATRLRDISIGSYAGFKNISVSIVSSNDNIEIGESANYQSTSIYNNNFWVHDNIKIGTYSGLNTAKYSNNILIGAYAGKRINADNVIAIGSSSSSNNTSFGPSTGYDVGQPGSQGIILIGAYAGASSRAKYGNIAIGSYAGYNSATSTSYLYGNVGIGYAACGFYMSQARNKWCLGWGGYSSAISTFWTPSNNDTPQMFVGYGLAPINTYTNTSIVFYANDVYKPTSTSFNTFSVASDRRLKTNIVPLRDNSLEKIRKVNIYDYTLKDDDHKVPQIGVVAQEHKKVFPQDVRIEPTSKLYAVGLDWMIYTMLDAIKDIDKNVQNLQNKTNAYIKDFMGLKSKVAKLEAQSKALNNQNKALKSRLAKINAKLK